ncbi:two-component system, NarL family, sensor histidine kinase DegS [Sulfobacillus thermosulfidooxidans DSM 9293]|uniref:histidine kinase n=1 Tax=Sulfobacillus thermosulfidooxidans (strain DSM 9293 / VKM B-1269 / AT-1) TaxID=929705 RepID=A0A1W1WCH0_SULTA|nr:sensor histidine kinase [Sulfobacillus thermosulfidooxidans]SMC03869.1 two-component system, NarL family, sensor histidine kinase DegS [Sulfobacillus thermosulfidooxidans DSM 9293]
MTPYGAGRFPSTGNGDRRPFSSALTLIEHERQRLARDLHDGPVQLLTNLSMRLSMMNRLLTVDPELASEEWARMNERLREAINLLRQVLYDLQPIVLDEAGLAGGVDMLVRRWTEETGIACTLTWTIPEALWPLSADDKIGVFRILQEALANIHKHAQATQVTLTAELTSEALIITLRDNGRGFDPSAMHPGHYGLSTMAQRAALVGATWLLETSPGAGTVCRLRWERPTL